MSPCILLMTIVLSSVVPLSPVPGGIGSAAADEPIKVIVTLPVLKDLVQQVGRDRVTVTGLLTGLESEPTYTPKPTNLIAISKAGMLVQVGLGLEGWVEGLIKNSGNRRILIITSSKGIPLLKNKDKEENSNDPHALGDPHIWLDPENVKSMVRHITEGFLKIDPAHKNYYMKNQAQYIQELDRTQQRLLMKLKPFRNRMILTHRAAWAYFARRFGFVIRGSITSQAGTEPSPKQLSDLIRMIKTEKIRVIVSEPQLDPKLPKILSQETGAKVVVLAPIPGALPGLETYIDMLEYDVDQLVGGLKD
jgi:ABC-type Zn uptake system ZnuABC Zn-binding protein ZnuA